MLLRKEFDKFTENSSLIEGSLNLMFERWLEKQLRAYFNPLVDEVARQEIAKKAT